ncbi:protein of unknown function [Amycolatopsis xylanica]|uniref:DUF4132 domain-containing protein n=1 Tax=Amycolatopsis xylanica TaxID=589385 RepID=A0A1H3SEF7_9PSEU|nr:DUF4132 domain-containing protein [Amycolatopsis xylanica]SDZ36284.1 protein of unknown function [Amycolatopsis xylanica]
MVSTDETSWVLPKTWRGKVHPRRGGTDLEVPDLNEGAARAVRAWLSTTAELQPLLDLPENPPELVKAAVAWLGGEANPQGAAVIATMLRHVRESPSGNTFADAWISEHGLLFAAEAIAELAHIELGHHWVSPGTHKLGLRYRPDGEIPDPYWSRGLAERVRAVLAKTDEETYQRAVTMLTGHRRSEFGNLVVSYLVPTEQHWVDELVAKHPMQGYPDRLRWTLLSAATAAQVEALSADQHFDLVFHGSVALYNLADAMGPALAPAIARALDRFPSAESTKLLAETLGAFPTDEAFGLLLDRIDRQHVQPVVLDMMRRYPVRALRLLGAATGEQAALLFRAHVLENVELARDPGLPEEPRARIEKVLSGEGRVAEAPAVLLPPLLADPPWNRERSTKKPLVLKDLVAPGERRIVFQDGEQEALAAIHVHLYNWRAKTDWQRAIDDVVKSGRHGYWDNTLLVQAPAEFVLPVLDRWPLTGYDEDIWSKRAVGRFGLAARGYALAAARAKPSVAGEVLLPFLDAEVASVMADWLVRLKAARLVAVAWLSRHGVEAAKLLIPAALGKAGKERIAAEAALRFLKNSADIVEAAKGYGPEATAAIEALAAEDPLESLPPKMPATGMWADPHLLPQLLLRGGEFALSPEATRHVITALGLCKKDEIYPGVEVIRELCDPRSLSEFAWALFQQWRSAGMPVVDSWALLMLGWFGDDDVVRRLSPIVNAWPGEGGHHRAVAGLEVLAEIGTDAALTQLNRISHKAKFKALKERAREKMAVVAEELGLSADQLSDRLVPTFGLDEDATLIVDYGTRRFVVGFDERLNPFVADEDGKHRKALPKPGVKDDPELAPAEYKRFAALKKDVRTVAADEIQRMEQAMVTRRAWSGAEFRELLAGHPLLWHIVRRLVWLSESGGEVIAFRLAEDRTFADVEDDEFTLPDKAIVAIAHPLELGSELGKWSELFADYEILQPFPQLGRAVHALSEQERTGVELARFQDVTVSVGNVLRLVKRGWERARAADNGCEPWLAKKIGDRAVVLNLDPGLTVGDLTMDPEHRIDHLWLNDRPEGEWSPSNPLPFGELDPLAASELLADLAELTR